MKQYWVIPPHQNEEFVAHMEDIIEVYHRPYDPNFPLVCMDEQPIQFIGEVKIPIPATVNHPERIDYEYKRNGTANVFMFTEPLNSWRNASIRETKTKNDWASEIKNLLDNQYPDAKKVVLVCDNYSTHTIGAFYVTFPPEEAARLLNRLEIHYTPKHGSWLNIAECELSVLTRQCLGRRIEDMQALKSEVNHWQVRRNECQIGVDWQFSTSDARIRLKHLYPEIKMS